MRHFTASTSLALLLGAFAPAAAPAQSFAITNAHILTAGPVGDVENATIVVRDGRIAAAGQNVSVPADLTVVDAGGKFVTPGLIAVDTALGLMEVNSVSNTNDSRARNSEYGAAFDVQYGLNPASTLIPVARLGGITRAIVMPGLGAMPERETPFAGKAAAISLGEGSDILYRAGVAMVLDLGEDGTAMAGGSRSAMFQTLRQIFELVKKPTEDLAFGLSKADVAALKPVLAGKMPVIVVVHRAADIRQVLRLGKEYGLNLILSDAEEAWEVADEIAAADVPVMLNPTSNIPSDFDMLGASLRNAAILTKAGVAVAVSGNDRGHRVRDMRYNAGVAVSRGMPYASAIAAITQTPAEIFGLADEVGSIGPGKQADIVIWDGDPLEPLSEAEAVYIAGEAQPLVSRATMLAQRYMRKR